MKIVFGKKGCSGCKQLREQLEKDNVNFRYIDVDNMDSEEMALAAWHSVLGSNKIYPIQVEDD